VLGIAAYFGIQQFAPRNTSVFGIIFVETLEKERKPFNSSPMSN
jgi:hypothetical protein